MKWIRLKWIIFDENDKSTWPLQDKIKIVRWVDYYNHIHYGISHSWKLTLSGDDPLYWGPRVNTYDGQVEIGLSCSDYENHKRDTLLTHWCYIDDTTDGYWEPYYHPENGNTYADKAWRDEDELKLEKVKFNGSHIDGETLYVDVSAKYNKPLKYINVTQTITNPNEEINKMLI